MGSSFIYSCSNCGYSFDFMLGIGFAYSPDSFYRFNWDEEENMWCYDKQNMWLSVIKSKKMLQEIKDIMMSKNGRLIENYGYGLYYSKSCKKIYNRFYFELYYNEDGQMKVFIPKYFDEHKKELIRINAGDVSKVAIECPKCKGTEFMEGIGPCWD
ncbi:hypothetical protein [Bacillus testis]|uniref:hypothetical protein n=1 Tax=Bacillus testis TaxID=1622072 RepID=UPI00067F21A5|nr:hypothetical protein [Bacillus testis]